MCYMFAKSVSSFAQHYIPVELFLSWTGLIFLFISGEEDEDKGGSGPDLYAASVWSSEMETGDLTLGHQRSEHHVIILPEHSLNDYHKPHFWKVFNTDAFSPLEFSMVLMEYWAAHSFTFQALTEYIRL